MLTTSLTLLDQLRQANRPDAWGRFVRLYTPLLVVWARRQGFQNADAEDLTQEVLVKLIRMLPSYERGKGHSFRGWLFRLCSNQSADYRRRLSTRSLPGSEGLSSIANGEPTNELEDAEYRRLLVHRALDLIRADFNEPTWAAFTATAVEGKTVKEVAAKFKLSENAVYLARHRVMTRLRQEIDGLLE